MSYKHYNPNPYGRRVDDCTVRAASKALSQSWEETFVGLSMDVLAHTAKDLLAVIAMQESEQGGGSYGRGYRESGYNRGGYGDNNGYGEGGYGARGRGRSRNSMGRFMHGGNEEYIQKLEKLMEEAPNDHMRQTIQRALDEAQRM